MARAPQRVLHGRLLAIPFGTCRKKRKASPDFYIGHSEGSPPHWGGEPRSAYVLGYVTLATGSPASFVRVDPAIPAVSGPPLGEVIVMARYPGDSLESMGDGSIDVNIIRAAAGIDIHKAAFEKATS